MAAGMRERNSEADTRIPKNSNNSVSVVEDTQNLCNKNPPSTTVYVA
jgi:hypothetical protein